MKNMHWSNIGITENIWLGSILALSFVIITFTIWCLTHGITVVYPNLYYILIVIVAYHYRKTGFFLVVLISLAYLSLVILFTQGSAPAIMDAVERIMVFLIIGAMIAWLSEIIARSWETINTKSQVQESVIQNANVLLVVLDPRGRVLDWNTAAEEISGYPAEDVIGNDRIWKYLYPDAAYRKTITGTITRVIRENQFFENFETDIRTKSGGQKTISWNTRTIPGEDGKTTGFVAIGIDVTPRKELERELTAIAHEWEATFDATSDGICLIGADYKIQRCNRQMSEILGGIPTEQIVGRSCFEIIDGTTGPVADCPFVTAKKTLRRTRSEVFQHGLWFEVTADPIFDPDGGFTGAVHIMRDITERKQAELAARESDEKYRAFFTTSRDCIFITTLDGHWVDFNDAAVEMFGYTNREDLLQTEISHMYANPEERAAHIRFIRENGYSFEYPVDLRKKDGTIINTLITTVVRKDPSGNIIGFQGSIRDITERKRVELALQASEKKYRTLFENMLEGFAYCRMIYDADGKPSDWVYLDVNRAFERLTGLTGITGKRVLEAIPDVRRLTPELFDTYGRVATTGIPETFEIDFKPLGMWLRVSVFSPEKGYFVAAFEDVTDRKRVEEALRESEEKFRGIFDMINDGIQIHEIQADGKPGKFIEVNEVACRMLQYTREELLGRGPLDFVTGYHSRPLDEITGELLSTGHAIFETEHRRKDGTLVPVEINTHVVTLQGKRVVVSTVRDITERRLAEEMLRQNQLQLANAMDLSQVVNWEFDVASGMFTFDDRFYALFGTTAEREGGHRMSAETYSREFVYPEDIPSVAGAIRNLLGTTDPLYRGQMEHRIIRRDGEIRTIIARYAPVMDTQGKVIRTFGANQDITERKAMEEALSESRQLFADIISFLPDPTFVIDAEGKVLAWNRAIEQLSGVSSADIIGKGDYEYSLWLYGKRRPVMINLVQNPDKDYARVNYREIVQQGQTITAETELIRAGKKVTLSLVASPLMDPEGKIIGAIESMRDITRIKETEAELARINAHLETLVKERTHALEEEVAQRRTAEQKVRDTLRHTRNVIEANPDLMVILDAQGILRDVNATAEQMTGLPREKLIGTPYNLYLLGNHNAEENFARLLREGSLTDIPYDVLHVNGKITPILSNTRVQRDDAGNVEYIITAAHDITQQKKDAEMIKASLEEKIILLREVHHRVKNNLQIIISLNNLQLRQVHDPQLKQFLNETKNRVRAMSLVHEKLYQSDSLSHIDLADYLRFLASQLFSYYSTDSRQVKLVVEIGKATIDINTAIPIGLIVNELVSNALKYAFPGDRKGVLVISGGLEGELLTVSVKDDGVGMPPDYDWKNATSLGLRLVNILADQIDGTVVVKGDQGTTFIITVRLKP